MCSVLLICFICININTFIFLLALDFHLMFSSFNFKSNHKTSKYENCRIETSSNLLALNENGSTLDAQQATLKSNYIFSTHIYISDQIRVSYLDWVLVCACVIDVILFDILYEVSVLFHGMKITKVKLYSMQRFPSKWEAFFLPFRETSIYFITPSLI